MPRRLAGSISATQLLATWTHSSSRHTGAVPELLEMCEPRLVGLDLLSGDDLIDTDTESFGGLREEVVVAIHQHAKMHPSPRRAPSAKAPAGSHEESPASPDGCQCVTKSLRLYRCKPR